MNAERFQQVEQLYYRALELATAERADFLAQACGTDEELRREVESLLAAHDEAGSFIAGNAVADHANRIAPASFVEQPTAKLPTLIGRSINQYKIVSAIGKGGMGEVWLAEDTRLHRKVALKLLPAEVVTDADRVRRFEQEAQAVSALNHPNIITLFDLGRAGSDYFMATEFIDGQTLRERLRDNARLPLAEAIEIALQICHALAAAHEAGIIHRDIKPENVMLRRDGYVKVLDFGLAKVAENQTPDSGSAQSSLTDPGTVMGTASYMSPEQARGQRVDARTDIFSLGIVLYEMIEGRMPFEGANTFEMVAAILEREPAPLGDAPEEVQRIISKALRKDREQRYQTIREFQSDLKGFRRQIELAEDRKQTSGETARPLTRNTDRIAAQHTNSSAQIIFSEIKRHKFGITATLVVLGALLAGGGYTVYRAVRNNSTPPKAPLSTAKLTPFTSFPGLESKQSFSPDGKQVAFVWGGEQDENSEIYIKQTDGEGLLRLTNNPAVDSDPVWSPDGRNIAFTRYTEESGGIYVMPAFGGAERKLTTFSPLRPTFVAGPELSWSPDGKLLAFGDRPSSQAALEIVVLNLATDERQSLTQPVPGGVGDFLPTFSPDGQTLAFVRVATRDNFREIFLQPLAGGVPRQLTSNKRFIHSLAWVGESTELIFSASEGFATSVWQIETSNGSERRITGPEALVAGAAVDRQRGCLSYTKVTYDSNVMRIGLNGRASDGKPPIRLLGGTTADSFQRYSPDGKKLVHYSMRSGKQELWLSDSNGQSAMQLTNDPNGAIGSANWSPDGQRVVYSIGKKKGSDLYLVKVEGGQPSLLMSDGFTNVVPFWSRDGKWIYYSSNRSGTLQIWKLPSKGGEPTQITKQGGMDPMESRDGKFLVYTKGRQIPGLWRIDLATGVETLITDVHKAGYWRSWEVAKNGIFFATSESPLRSMIEFYDFVTGKVSLVTKLRGTFSVGNGNISVSPDGRWLTYLEEQLGGDLVLVENWR